jgi:hypothetical protein
LYFEHLDKQCRKGKIKDVEQRRRLFVHLRFEIQKLCMVKSYVNIEEMLLATKGIKKVLNELGEMPFETFKEK